MVRTKSSGIRFPFRALTYRTCSGRISPDIRYLSLLEKPLATSSFFCRLTSARLINGPSWPNASGSGLFIWLSSDVDVDFAIKAFAWPTLLIASLCKDLPKMALPLILVQPLTINEDE